MATIYANTDTFLASCAILISGQYGLLGKILRSAIYWVDGKVISLSKLRLVLGMQQLAEKITC